MVFRSDDIGPAGMCIRLPCSTPSYASSFLQPGAGMTIVRSTYRYKPPPRKRKAAPRAGPAIVTPKRKPVLAPTDAKKLDPAAAVVRKAKPGNDNRPDVVSQNKPAVVTPTSRKRRISDGPPLPLELPLSRKPVERDGGDYKRLKAAMTLRLRGE